MNEASNYMEHEWVLLMLRDKVPIPNNVHNEKVEAYATMDDPGAGHLGVGNATQGRAHLKQRQGLKSYLGGCHLSIINAKEQRRPFAITPAS
ncbi:hypothetical protein AHAS_Ahas04G0135000 [Arachis hypogaea]